MAPITIVLQVAGVAEVAAVFIRETYKTTYRERRMNWRDLIR